MNIQGWVVYQKEDGYLTSRNELGFIPFVFESRVQAKKAAWKSYSWDMDQEEFEEALDSGLIQIMPYEKSNLYKAKLKFEKEVDKFSKNLLSSFDDFIESNEIVVILPEDNMFGEILNYNL